MKTNERSRDEGSSQHGGSKSAVLPTADSPKHDLVTAPLHGSTGKVDPREGKDKDLRGAKGQPDSNKYGGKQGNPNAKR
ncbi:MAG: hypothetical protein LW860_08650 [Xanthomonadaceae bacterium]|jgi:hypothetical protein|nr:hypothetical protein [Xanthomonadaceae bacterium]